MSADPHSANPDTRPDSVGQAHTPAPWFVAAQNDGLVIIDGPPSPAPYDGPIPKAHGPNVVATPNWRLPEHEANARFIVHAVNCHDELLEALIEVRRVGDDKLAFRSEWAAAVRKADAAIAKAKGGQP